MERSSCCCFFVCLKDIVENMTEIRYTEIAKVPSIKEESVMPCVDFNTFIQKLPADCKDFFDEDYCRFTLPKKSILAPRADRSTPASINIAIKN